MAEEPREKFLQNLLHLDIITLVVDEVPVDTPRSLHRALGQLVRSEQEAALAHETVDGGPDPAPSLAEIQTRLRAIGAGNDQVASDDKGARSASFDGFASRAVVIADAIGVLKCDEKKLALMDPVNEDELRAVMKIGHLAALGREEVQIRTRMSLLGDVVTWVRRDAETGLTEVHQHSVQSAVGWWGTLLNTAVSALGSLFKLLLK